MKQDFGLFKKDSNAVAPVREEPKQLSIEFDAEEGTDVEAQKTKSVNTIGEKKEEPKTEKNIFNRFIKKTETDKKKLKEGDFEDDDF